MLVCTPPSLLPSIHSSAGLLATYWSCFGGNEVVIQEEVKALITRNVQILQVQRTERTAQKRGVLRSFMHRLLPPCCPWAWYTRPWGIGKQLGPFQWGFSKTWRRRQQ